MPIAVVNNKAILFVHIPKTGGTSVETWLAGQGRLFLKSTSRRQRYRCSLQHLHCAPVNQLIDDGQIDYSFMIVRHPVARIISEYRYQMRKKNRFRGHLSFSGWLSYSFARRSLKPYYRDNHFRPQVEFECPHMDVLHFEDGVDHCIANIAAKLGIPAPDNRIREKVSPEIDLAISEKDLRRIGSVYNEDLLRFGYKMDRASLILAGVPESSLLSISQ